MSFPKNVRNREADVSAAHAVWIPTKQEKNALLNRSQIDQLGQIDHMWHWLAEKYPGLIAVNAPHAFHPETFSYSELAKLIDWAAAGFSQLGLKRGEVVSLFAENSPRWLIADQGLMRIGVSDAVRGAASPRDELQYILEDSNSVGLIIQNSAVWAKLALTNDLRRQLKVVVQLEGIPSEDVMSWESLLELGRSSENLDKLNSFDSFENHLGNIATIIYTSGTTGRPKGVPLSHANILHQIKSLACVANPPSGSPVLSVLPIWHAYERSAEYYFFSCGCSQTYTSIKYLKEDLPKVRPIIMATVPRLWEAIQIGLEDVINKMPNYRKTFFKIALSNSINYKRFLRKTYSLWLDDLSFFARFLSCSHMLVRWPLHFLAAKFLWPKVVRKLSGGQLKYPINGGGAIAPHVDAFFEGLGIELLVGYGLTETSPVLSCRRPWRNLRGSSGTPLPDTEFKIVDQETFCQKSFREKGRVLVRGPQVMSGYLGKPEATAKVLSSDGWFDTGDVGMLLENGELILTGRAKDTIVLSNGENIEPGPLEEVLLSSPLVEQIMLVGQDEKQLGVLLVPQKTLVAQWAAKKGLQLDEEQMSISPGNRVLRSMLKREFNYLLSQRKGSRPDERVIDVAFVAPFSIENGLLTQTLKQKREQIRSRDKKAINSIYKR